MKISALSFSAAIDGAIMQAREAWELAWVSNFTEPFLLIQEMR